MSTNLKVSAALVAAFAAVVAAFLVLGQSNSDSSADGDAAGGVQVVREDSHRLGEPGAGDVTLVELPTVGIRGNTHFPMSDLNNAEVANHMAGWLRQKGLDR